MTNIYTIHQISHIETLFDSKDFSFDETFDVYELYNDLLNNAIQKKDINLIESVSLYTLAIKILTRYESSIYMKEYVSTLNGNSRDIQLLVFFLDLYINQEKRNAINNEIQHPIYIKIIRALQAILSSKKIIRISVNVLNKITAFTDLRSLYIEEDI